MWNRKLKDEIRRLQAALEYEISVKERIREFWNDTAKKLQRVEDQLKVEKVDGYAAIESIGRQSSRLWHLENQIIQRDKEIDVLKAKIERLDVEVMSAIRVSAEMCHERDKEIALLKYHAANPTFDSTHTPAVQEKKGKRK